MRVLAGTGRDAAGAMSGSFSVVFLASFDALARRPLLWCVSCCSAWAKRRKIRPRTGTAYSDDLSLELARSSLAMDQRRFSIAVVLAGMVLLSGLHPRSPTSNTRDLPGERLLDTVSNQGNNGTTTTGLWGPNSGSWSVSLPMDHEHRVMLPEILTGNADVVKHEAGTHRRCGHPQWERSPV